MLASSCGFSSAGESAQSLMSSALGTGTTEAATLDTEPTERTSAAGVWQINDATSGPDSNFEHPDFITAANGITVRVEIPESISDAELNDTELEDAEPLEQVSRLVVIDPSGNVAWTTAAGGIVATELGLVDFDGRYVLLERSLPDPVSQDAQTQHTQTQHVVYDLDCRTVDTVDCTHDFWATPGTAELATDTAVAAAAELNIQLMALCPTAGQQFTTPSELEPEQAQAYQQAAAILATCDPAGIDADPADLTYRPSQGQSGWRWTEFAAALSGPYQTSSLNTLVWGPSAGGSTVQVRPGDPDGTAPRFSAGEEPSGAISVTMGQSHLLLTGSVAESVAGEVVAAAADLAASRDRQLVDRLTFDGPQTPPTAVADLLTSMDDQLNPSSIVSGHVDLTPLGDVQHWTSPGIGPTATELKAVDALAAFAGGDVSSFAEIPLADHVLLAAEHRVVARRSRSALEQRNGWRLDLVSLGDAPGPFNILNQARGSKDVTVGALHGCDETAPTPAPTELANLRRLSVQPDQRLIQSCRQWNNVDLYFDDSGRIAGVGLSLFGR